MNPSSYFFRVEHDLLRSEAFKTLGGSAIKVYLVIGLYSDFGTDWAYPSIRTIARQAGLSRQTVLNAIEAFSRSSARPASSDAGGAASAMPEVPRIATATKAFPIRAIHAPCCSNGTTVSPREAQSTDGRDHAKRGVAERMNKRSSCPHCVASG